MTTTSPASPVSPAPPDEKRKRFGLSWIQIAAAGFASITATVILSFFSISGTLIGAAVFSMASAVGNAVYGSSLRKSRDVVLEVVPFGKADPASPTVVLPVTEEAEAVVVEPALPAEPGTLSRRAWKRVALFAVAIFAFVMAVVTGVELVAGRPLTDLLRGEQGSGTSLTGGSGSGGGSIPIQTVTVTPSVVYTTPTVTQPAPSTVTETQTQTGTVTNTPTSAPTSDEPTAPATGETTGAQDTASSSPSATRTSAR